MNSNTLLRIGVVLVACAATLAGCGRKTDETPTATQPTAPAATTEQQAAPEPPAAPRSSMSRRAYCSSTSGTATTVRRSR